MPFTAHSYFDGIFHIEDAMGVCFTLIEGKSSALLLDAGYGLEDPNPYIRTLTDKPVTFWLSHGHHDHALGAMWFDRPHIAAEEKRTYEKYTAPERRRRVLGNAASKDIKPPDEAVYLTLPMPSPVLSDFGSIDLGGLTANILPVPGHTPGSVMIYITEYRLLLTGDDWNPCTWLFFPEALPIRQYRWNMGKLLEQIPFLYALCPHRTGLYKHDMIESFVDGITDDAIVSARPCETGKGMGIDTHEIPLPMDQIIVFDAAKAERSAV